MINSLIPAYQGPEIRNFFVIPVKIHTCILLVSLLVANNSLADQNDARLNDLFHRLQTTRNPGMAQLISEDIWNIWSRSNDGEIDELFYQGKIALGKDDYLIAYSTFDQIIELSPNFAEAWSKRATTLYRMEKYSESLADIDETLKREPRHFGALVGQGMCYLKFDKLELALVSFDKALKLNPWLGKVRAKRKELRNLIDSSI